MGPRMLGPKMPMWALQRSCLLDSSGHGWQCLWLWASHPCKYKNLCVCVCARSVTQSCLTDCDPMDCSPPVFLCPWDFSSNHTGEGCHFLLQRIFPTQGSNLGLLHLQEGSFPLRHLGSHKYKIHKLKYKYVGGFSWWLRGKEPTCQ